MPDPSGDLERLMEAHYAEVHGLLWALTRNRATADDLAQEVFIVALKRGMAPGEGMRFWLRETARRIALSDLRRKRPTALQPEDLQALPGMSSDLKEAEDGALGFSDELDVMRECLKELPESDRRLLNEKYQNGASIEALAEQFGLSADYVKLKLFRLRKLLSEKITRRINAERAGQNSGSLGPSGQGRGRTARESVSPGKRGMA